MMSYEFPNQTNDFSPAETQVPSETEDSFLEELVHQKAHILSTKLEVLTAEVLVRLNILSRNLRDVEHQKESVCEMLGRINQLANYHLRDHRETGVLYRQLFALDTERRQQEVECWRDVAMIMKDFLGIWEYHQQAQARAIFLKDAGS